MKPLLRQSWPYLAAIVSGMGLMFCFPPFEQDWLAWLTLIPLLVAAWFGKLSPLKRLLAGYLCGIFFFAPTFSWLGVVTPAGWLVLSLYLALYPALWTWFAGFPMCRLPFDRTPLSKDDRFGPWRRSITSIAIASTLASAWALLEWLRGWLFTGMGWNGLGVTLHANIPFLQLTSFGGVPLLSFLIVFGNVIAVTTVVRLLAEAGRLTWASRSDFTIALALILGAFTFGLHLSFRESVEREIKISLVQGAPADPDNAGEDYLRLSSLALIQKPDVIIWPENAIGKPILDSLDELKKQAATFELATDRLPCWLIVGSEEHAPDGSFNSAFAIAPELSGLQTYRKRHLLPFYEAGWPGLRSAFSSPTGFSAGTSAKPFWIIGADARLGSLICIEDTVPALARENALADANILLGLTSDTLFHNRTAERQHFLNALFRAPETGLPLIRCASTGVSAIIDAQGRISQELKSGTPGILTGNVSFQKHPTPTFLTRYGFWVPLFFAGIIGLRLLVCPNRKTY